jgi:S1-C subfamily serine protease
MFVQACNQIRECIYGLMGLSQTGPNQVNVTNATGFMVVPGILVTAAHFCHVENDPSKDVHSHFEAIRSPDIGQHMQRIALIAADTVRDIALLRIDNPRSTSQVQLECDRVPTGTNCGSLGFPLASVVVSQSGKMFNLTERFQGASISAYQTSTTPTGRALSFYETDALMYGGSSGCPGFLIEARVFGMHVASVVDPMSAQANAAQPG